MSESLTIARPYARAAFETARDQQALAAWSQQLAFSAQVLGDARVSALIGDPRLSHADLVALLLPPDATTAATFASFLSLLVENHRVTLLPDITALFAAYKHEAEHVLKATLRTASVVSQAQVDAIKLALKKRFNRDIELDQIVDPTVLGGAIVDAGDTVIDGSVRGRLARLEAVLTQ